MPLSGKEMVRLLKKSRFEVVKGQGKGSHVKLRNSQGLTVIVPMHKELKKGTEQAILKIIKGANQ